MGAAEQHPPSWLSRCGGIATATAESTPPRIAVQPAVAVGRAPRSLRSLVHPPLNGYIVRPTEVTGRRMKRYVLLYGDVEIGEVVEQDSDFPNCFGKWSPSTKADQSELRSHIQAYFEYSEHADSLMTPDVTPAWEAYTEEREHEFLDLIESSQWSLRDDSGTKHPLLVPRFCVGRALVWRYDPRLAV